MPGWHAATEKLRADGKIRMVGIVQEQHPERARLFMQWKRMGWPILVDSLNLLEVSVVPLTLAIDEHGIIRQIRPSLRDPQGFRSGFLDAVFDPPDDPLDGPQTPDLETARRNARERGTSRAWEGLGNALFSWGGAGRLDEAIEAYREAVKLEPDRSTAHFRLGVSLRRRYDSPGRRDHDFQDAVEHWSRALEIDPNNYIYRRRIQQYGPRLDQPYPFYDWVPRARREIEARGEVPVRLATEPVDAEFARPSRSLEPRPPDDDPDPEGRISRDPGRFVNVEATVVPRGVRPGEAARVHVVFRPEPGRDAHWNNEVGGLTVWLEPPDGWEVERRRLVLEKPRAAVSDEPRRVEFEVRAPAGAGSGERSLRAYSLYYVCEGERGACLYRRQDFRVGLHVLPPR